MLGDLRPPRLLLPLLLACSGACYGEFQTPEQTTADKATRPGQKAAPSPQQRDQRPQTAPATGETRPQEQQEKPPAQSYTEAWRLICDAEQLAGVDPTANRQRRGAQVARWIVEHVSNKQARYWWISYGEKKPQEREALFRAEAARAGVKQCALTSLLFPPAAPPPSAD